MNSTLHPPIELRPRADQFAHHDTLHDLARALGGIGAWPECSEHCERMRSAMDQLNIGPC
jgi:hypothetical protein